MVGYVLHMIEKEVPMKPRTLFKRRKVARKRLVVKVKVFDKLSDMSKGDFFVVRRFILHRPITHPKM